MDGSCSASCTKLKVIECNELQKVVYQKRYHVRLDIAKRVFQAHGTDATEKAALRRKLQRAEALAFFACFAVLGGHSSVQHGSSLGP